jgi:hypothetical protein
MTALGAGQIAIYVLNDSPDRFGVFHLKNFTTGDTVDVLTWFANVRLAVVVAPTKPIAGVCTFTGTVITLAPAGMANEGGYLAVYGASAQ